MYQTNPGLEDVVANSMSSLSFSGVTLVFVLAIVGAVWCAVPLALFSIRRRMDSLERAVDENSHVVANDLRRITDMLLLDRMQRAHGGSGMDSGDAAGKAPHLQSVHTSIVHPASAQADQGGKQPSAFIQPRSAQVSSAPRRISAA